MRHLLFAGCGAHSRLPVFPCLCILHFVMQPRRRVAFRGIGAFGRKVSEHYLVSDLGVARPWLRTASKNGSTIVKGAAWVRAKGKRKHQKPNYMD